MATLTERSVSRTADPAALRDAILRKCRESMATKEDFFTAHAAKIAECAAAMARAFDQGGRLIVMGNGGSSCDAAHVSRETHETLLHILRDLIHVIRGEEDVI